MELNFKHRPETLTQQNDLVKEYVHSLKPKETFYDLGSCVGTYGIMAYSLGLKVYAFEADDVNYNALVENFFCNFEHGEDFKTFNMGIADRKGEIELRIGQPEIGGHHKTLALDSFCGHPSALGGYVLSKQVQVNSLDNIIKEYNLLPPNHIKVDIDGSEYAFLLGAENSLKQANSLMIELYEDNDYYQKIMDIIEKDNGFKLFKVGTDLEPGLKDYWFIK